MAHKVKVNGTIYQVGGGKTLIGGTAYSIKGGKTLVEGTAYSVGFDKTVKFLVTGARSSSFNYSGYPLVGVVMVHVNGEEIYVDAGEYFTCKVGDAIAVYATTMAYGTIVYQTGGVIYNGVSYTGSYSFIAERNGSIQRSPDYHSFAYITH